VAVASEVSHDLSGKLNPVVAGGFGEGVALARMNLIADLVRGCDPVLEHLLATGDVCGLKSRLAQRRRSAGARPVVVE